MVGGVRGVEVEEGVEGINGDEKIHLISGG